MGGDSPVRDSPNAWRLPPDFDRVLISVNPKAGRSESRPTALRLAELLKARRLYPQIVENLDEMADLAARWHESAELRAVVAAGGDGTIAEIVNRVPVGVPTTVLPLGTENLLAKYLGIRRQPESVGEAIVGGAAVRLDAGRAVSPAGSSSLCSNGRIFLLMARCGLDADVVHRLEQARRGHISHLSYAKPILASFRNYRYPPLRIELRGPDLASSSIVARWTFLFNLPCYARGLPFTPHAHGADGLLDLCAFGRGSFWHGMRYLLAVVTGWHHRLADCTLRQVTGLRVEADEPVPFQLDGDFGGHLPLEIEMLPRRLTLIVPEAWHRTHRVE